MTTSVIPHFAFRESGWVQGIRFWAVIPLVYLGCVPMLLLDAFLELYHRLCFPVWGVPRVRRADHLHFDRSKLPYLAWHQKLGCFYCSYANGLASYFREIAARTEQYWCPIRHAQEPASPHSRYHKFLPHGDAQAFRQRRESVRDSFEDLRR